MWHLQLITGLVILISLSRFLLLKTWTDFGESSKAANHQVLTSLQPLDCMVVAFSPGVSEELLFRGALLPLFENNWKSALVLGSCYPSWCFALGKWPKVFLCNLGNICWVCLWLCDNCILENHCANGFTCSKQSVWRDRTKVHVKVVKID